VLAWYGPLAGRLLTTEDAENPKGRLQELVQPEHGNNALRYDVTSTTGPRHAREYTVAVFLNDRQLGTGSGPSKKVAEEVAARVALATLRTAAGET
jgi:ribonuclease-3